MIPALARRGEVVLHDELSHCSIVDGCRLSGADVVAYRHADAEHLAWALRQCDGRATLIATDGMFGMDGDVAPLAEIVALARRYDVRALVDEAHALGALGAGGRGAVAEAGLEGEIDVVTGTLGKALGSYGGFVACDARDRALPRAQRPHAAALDRAAAGRGRRGDGRAGPAGGAAAPRREAARQRRGAARRRSPARASTSPAPPPTSIPLVVGDAELRRAGSSTTRSSRACSPRRVRPPAVPEGTARVRVSAMASHTRAELRGAATALGRAALRAGFRPGAGLPVAAAQGARLRRPVRPRESRVVTGVSNEPAAKSRTGVQARIHACARLRLWVWPHPPQSSTSFPTSRPAGGPSMHRTRCRRGSPRSVRPSRPRCARPAPATRGCFLHDRYHRVRPLFARRSQA